MIRDPAPPVVVQTQATTIRISLLTRSCFGPASFAGAVALSVLNLPVWHFWKRIKTIKSGMQTTFTGMVYHFRVDG